MAMYYFLLVYNQLHGALETVQRFADKDDAGRAYIAAERAAQGNPELEIVLVGADSIETIQQTHGQYFDAPTEQSRYLEAASDTDSGRVQEAGHVAPVPAG
jgi:hypothetical protein